MQPIERMLGAPRTARQASSNPEVLQYLGYDEDYGGITAVIRALAAVGPFQCVLGMNARAIERQVPPLGIVEFPRVRAETPGGTEMIQTWRVARTARRWLHADKRRVFHVHSRAGLLAALWLRAMGETRVLASVHTFGRHRRLYRAAARLMGTRLYWLSPAMKRHYRVGDASWAQCLPDCIPETMLVPPRRNRGPALVLAAVGPFARYKRMELLIRALGCLDAADRPKVRVIQAGAVEITARNRAYARELRALAMELGVAGMIEWRGVIRPLAPLWSEVNCLVVPSPIEAFSVTALEALAAGVPVIASTESGTSDLVNATRGGWLFSGDDPAALAASIRTLLASDALSTWQLDAEALRAFFAPAVAERYAAAYAELLH